jgi:hypothetical protein
MQNERADNVFPKNDWDNSSIMKPISAHIDKSVGMMIRMNE